jgi:hypothetical protein
MTIRASDIRADHGRVINCNATAAEDILMTRASSLTLRVTLTIAAIASWGLVAVVVWMP